MTKVARLSCFAVTALSVLLLPHTATACRTVADLEPADVRHANSVVIGTITNYRIVRDEAFRRRMLANPHLSADMRKLYTDPSQSLMGDYARFDVEVSETLLGRPARNLTVTWDNSTFGEPSAMSAAPYLIALRDPSAPLPPLRGPSATISPSREPDRQTVLQAPCAPAFIFPADSSEAAAIRQLLRRPER